MIWNKPKKFLKKLLVILTVISSIVTVLALITFYIWNYKPELVNEIDNKILGYYLKSYNEPFAKALQLKQQGKNEEALEKFNELFLRMRDFGKIDRLYHMKRKVLKNIVDLSIKLEKFDRAQEITEYWVKSDERDIDAKRMQIDFLIKLNKLELAEEKYNILFEKFRGVKSIATEYINFLILHNKYAKALSVQNIYNEHKTVVSGSQQFMNNAKFKIFYTENHKENFSEKKSIVIDKYNLNNTFCEIQKNGYSKKIKKLRFDIDYVQNFYIYDLSIVLINNLGMKFKAKIIKKSLHDLENIDYKYVYKGKDPHFEIEIPDEIKDDNITDFAISFNIKESEEKNLLQDVFKSREWQLYYSYNNVFTEKSSMHLELDNIVKNKLFLSKEKNLNKNSVNKIRIDLPSLIGLSIKRIKIKIMDINKTIHTFNFDAKNENIRLNSIEKNKQNFKIISNDPYIIFNISKEISIKKATVEVEL